MVGEVRFHGRGLVRGDGENVAETAAGEDDRFTSLFGGSGAGARDDLCGADRGDVRACARK